MNLVSAPANIALIKYMGKVPGLGNRPTNASLSFTLNRLSSHVRWTRIDADQDQWQPLIGKLYSEIHLSDRSRNRFLKHFEFLKRELNIEGNFLLESANDFPSDCGLASSASSFAALTKAAAEISIGQNKTPVSDLRLAELSRQGSGSSCRSFFAPWSLWDQEGARKIDLPQKNLIHQVVVIETEKKKVSSSEAHRLVLSSELFTHRPERAEKRLVELVAAFKSQSWDQAFEITWAEFWDMHVLFETSKPSFGYMTPGSIATLNFARDLWQGQKDGPLVTMDAGANVHLLWRQDQAATAQKFKAELKYAVI
jgi:diphosphomevalonate decarboxylase